MQDYEYEVADRDGQVLKGRLQADSKRDAIRQLYDDDKTVIEVTEYRSILESGFHRRLKARDLMLGFHELATLLDSGVSLGDAVLAQSRGSYHPELKRAFTSISRDLMRGESPLAALRASGLALPEYVYNLVEAGEMSGTLAQSLRQAVDQMEYDQRVADEFRNALTYPTILVVSGVTAVLLVFVFVVPQFSNLLDDSQDLPWLAEVVLRTGLWFNDNSWLFSGVVAGCVAAAIMLLRKAAVRQRLVDGLARFPLLRIWFLEADTAQWASVMSAMLTSRVELMEALDLALRGVRITRRKTKLQAVIKDVRGGVSLSEALEKQEALTPTGYNLIRVGEQSGQLAKTLRSLARLCEGNSTRRMKQFLTLVEPVAILLIGGILGVIMVGIILAITSVNEITL